jgi:hypothetical protein
VDNYELPVTDLVSCRRGVARHGKQSFPKQFAGQFVEGAEFAVEIRGLWELPWDAPKYSG